MGVKKRWAINQDGRLFSFTLHTCQVEICFNPLPATTSRMAGSSTVGSSTWTTNSVIRGHHIYKAIWTPITGEQLFLKAEDRNEHDEHAVAVTNSEENVIGHMPRSLLPVSWFFIKNGGCIECVVTGHRKFGNGLEVPCEYTYKGSRKLITKLKRLLGGQQA